ncbi:hypothetical protein CR513_16474, partial [Mucuna pruriens]
MLKIGQDIERLEMRQGKLPSVRCIKGGEGNILVIDQDIKREMRELFYKLFNDGQGSICNMEGLEI